MRKIEVREYASTIDITDAVAVVSREDWEALCNLCHEQEYSGGIYQGSETKVKCREVREWLLSLLSHDKLFMERDNA